MAFTFSSVLYLTPFLNSTFSIGISWPETGGSLDAKFIFIKSVCLFISPPPKIPLMLTLSSNIAPIPVSMYGLMYIELPK